MDPKFHFRLRNELKPNFILVIISQRNFHRCLTTRGGTVWATNLRHRLLMTWKDILQFSIPTEIAI